jgi:RNA polymerase sigma factor (sigma-70 family)
MRAHGQRNTFRLSGMKPTRAMTTDAQLIKAARTDADAFGELYRRHAGAVHAFLRNRAPDRVAGELTAETFAQAALSWLYGIARNLLRTYHERERIESKARQRLGLPARDYELEVHEANARVDAERLAPELSAALDTLPRAQRQALELRVVQQLPYKQVALSLDCSEVAARIRVTRAIDSLSRLLKGVS